MALHPGYHPSPKQNHSYEWRMAQRGHDRGTETCGTTRMTGPTRLAAIMAGDVGAFQRRLSDEEGTFGKMLQRGDDPVAGAGSARNAFRDDVSLSHAMRRTGSKHLSSATAPIAASIRLRTSSRATA